MDFSLEVYQAAKTFPRDETYGIISQLRRAVVSIPANIAEGNARAHAGDYLRHLSFARGSVAEVETLLELSARLQYLGSAESRTMIHTAERIGQMLNRLMQAIQRKAAKEE